MLLKPPPNSLSIDHYLFSILIPVFNRPDELRELLASLREQVDKGFEVIIVEDKSSIISEEVVVDFKHDFPICYHYEQQKVGPGGARNVAASLARGDYFIILDSDCIVPPHYLHTVRTFLKEQYVDFFGGPDAAHPDFTPLQHAISYTMTSFFTTGGIRGGTETLGKFQPRSFNMGSSRLLWKKMQGFSSWHRSEDIDFTFRAWNLGFSSSCIPQAYVYHKRRTSIIKFFWQVFHFGEGRVRIHKVYPERKRRIFMLPSLFFLGVCTLLILTLSQSWLFISPLFFFAFVIFIDAWHQWNIHVGLLSIFTAFVQLMGYGIGYLKETFFPVSQKLWGGGGDTI